MIEIIMWIVTALSLIGTVANVHKKRWCFGVWIFTNAAWTLYDIHKIAYPQAFLQFTYLCISIYGLVKWGRKAHDKPGKD